MLQGMERNVALAESVMRPVAAYLESVERGRWEPADWILAQNVGWDLRNMLPYFYRDWTQTTEFVKEERLIVDALRRHNTDTRCLALLGCGASGLAPAMAAYCDRTYAVDLSMPTLLLAQRLLRGESVDMSIERAGWSPVQLRPRAATSGVDLVCADVLKLPFADASMPAIVTQYVMEVVANPVLLMAEVGRVLEPGGIWVNFSTPIRLPADPAELAQPTLAESADLMQTLSFELLEGHRQQHTFLDVRGLDECADVSIRETHLTVARKTDHDLQRQPIGAGEPVIGPAREWWERVPFLPPGVEIHVALQRRFSSNGESDASEVGANIRGFPTNVRVPRPVAEFVGTLSSQIDGKRTLREVWKGLEHSRIAIDDQQFHEVIQYLSGQLELIQV